MFITMRKVSRLKIHSCIMQTNQSLIKATDIDMICLSYLHMSCIVRKPDYCLCENKGADQLCSNCTADQRLCFRYTVFATRIVQFLFFLNLKFQPFSLFWNCTDRFVSDLVRCPEDRFSRVVARMCIGKLIKIYVGSL